MRKFHLFMILKLWAFFSYITASIWRLKGGDGIEERLCLDLASHKISNNEALYDWFHCASLGEAKALRAWLEVNQVSLPHVVLTCQRFEAKVILQDFVNANKLDWVVRVAPLDHSKSLKIFFDNFKVKRFFVYESDFWPMTIEILKSQQAELHWVNARIHPSQVRRGSLYKYWVRSIWQSGKVSARSLADQVRFGEIFQLDVHLGMDTKLILSVEDGFKESSQPPKGIAQPHSKSTQEAFPQKITLALVSVHLDELKGLKPFLANLQTDEFYLVVLPRHLNESKSIKKTLQKYSWQKMEVIEKFGMVKATLEKSQFAFVGGGLSKISAMHNIYEVLYSPASLWVLPDSGHSGSRIKSSLHPWEDQLLTLKQLNLVKLWGDREQSPDFSENLTQYRWEIEKQFQKAQEVWNQIHLER